MSENSESPPVADWDWEFFEKFINNGYFSITQTGPLSGPIKSFSVKRDEKLELILESNSSHFALAPSQTVPAGTVRLNTDSIEFTDEITGVKAKAIGVQPITRENKLHGSGDVEMKEISTLQSLEAIDKRVGEPKYTIEWLANIDSRYYHWPHLIIDETENTSTRSFSIDNSGPILKSTQKKSNRRLACVKTSIGGYALFLGAASERSEDPIKRGFIIYMGLPSEEIREKIRICLSLSLGVYLVYLGYATFSSNWSWVSFKAVSAYSLDQKVFDIPVLRLTHLSNRGINEIDTAIFPRVVNAFFSHYEQLDFVHLSWLYWHAVCSPSHATPVLMGAAIEALQRAYIEKEKLSITQLLTNDDWKSLKCKLLEVVPNLAAGDDIKTILKNNIGNLNKAPQNLVAEKLFNILNLKLGAEEKTAWKQRNDAGHGNRVSDGDFVQHIRNNKLLRIRFNRMILRMTNANDNYFDDYTIGHKVRKLEEPVA